MGVSVYSEQLEEKIIKDGDFTAKITGNGDNKMFVIQRKDEEISFIGEKAMRDFKNFINDNF